MLTEAETSAINAQFSLDLDYNNATHYRAAQVIWSLAKLKNVIIQDSEEPLAQDTQEAGQGPEGSA